jgi:hypothetical protein
MPNHPTDQKRSIISWMTPEPGDILSYAYLWHREALAGQEEGLKDRPAVVVVAQTIVRGRTHLFVAPITHSAPKLPADAIELPKSVKQFLGLDTARSWIVVTELNRFVWPGPDVRPIKTSDSGSPLYGPIPAWLFLKIKAEVLACSESGKLGITKRSQ